jgi:DNA modification methylase/transcriptional regulator with XRE-family HTH domain
MRSNLPGIQEALLAIRTKSSLSQAGLAKLLDTSLASINKWENGSSTPSPTQRQRIYELYEITRSRFSALSGAKLNKQVFASNGAIRRQPYMNTLFDDLAPEVKLTENIQPSILSRLRHGRLFGDNACDTLWQLISEHKEPAVTVDHTPDSGMSAGKNTYTYDAHTYHTKVPPQGIMELVKHYLPNHGLVLDPFAGSGMTGVACQVLGYDCILNELSPAACFLANRFTSYVAPELFYAGTHSVLDELAYLRKELYSTECRECGKLVDILYTIWSYKTICNRCGHEFVIWDHCRKYGASVREHKILSEFHCPNCQSLVKKSQLKRTNTCPVMVVYKCCDSDYQHHPLNEADFERLARITTQFSLAEGFYPTTPLPDGVNLRQPKKHGLDRVDKFYTARNLIAMSHLWQTIHRIEDDNLAAFLAFVFTSLYQRVTRLSEFRFWGGSGNMARYNVPFIFKEANVFDTFARKAESIHDHLATTASHYKGRVTVINGTATNLDQLPNECVDLIFTDPPFGANINYSEMNFLWESWLGAFTDSTEEAIVNSFQNKGIQEYQQLMTNSLKECYRVLRAGHWLLLVFMNSSQQVWLALKQAIFDAGFEIRQVDIFDKHHGTFKQFVSPNTAGADLVLHCFKPLATSAAREPAVSPVVAPQSLNEFLASIDLDRFVSSYLHVEREAEVDYRTLYSEWLAQAIRYDLDLIDFAQFRNQVRVWLDKNKPR